MRKQIKYYIINTPHQCLLICILCMLLSKQAVSQTEVQQDTLSFKMGASESVLKEGNKRALNRPTKAALLAMAVPGLGQVYNKKYWKVPLVYGGFTFFAWLIEYNHVEWQQYRDALFLLTDGDDNTNPSDIFDDPRIINSTQDRLRRGLDRYRRERDFAIILAFAWYSITVADAIVDAHLDKFNISDDLSAKLRPSVIDTGFNLPAAGIKLVFYLGG